jgi:nucleoside 2-deoxyribosyltransferase
MKIYLASPLGFSEAGQEFYYETLIPEVTARGHTVLDPWKLTEESKIDAVRSMPYGEDRQEAWRQLNPEIGHNNRLALDQCEAVLAVLDGVDVDSGTSSEIGYAYARGKKILGYRGDFRLSADNDGSKVNLQVEYFIRQSGGDIFNSLTDLWSALANLQPSAPAAASETAKPLRYSSPPGKRTPGEQRAAFIIVTLMLALIVRAALESAFSLTLKLHHEVDLLNWVLWLQLVLFFTMMVRFYLGATRYVDTEPKNIGLIVKAVNCIFAFILFCVFYTIALSITTTDYYFGLFVLHCVDILWFLIVMVYTYWSPPQLESGDIRADAARKIMLTFLGLSAITIIFSLILYVMYLGFCISEYSAEIVFMSGLIAISIFDFVYLGKYYFDHKEWIKDNAVP